VPTQSNDKLPQIVLPRSLATVREREILRVAGYLIGGDRNAAVKIACDEVLRWAQKKAVVRFEKTAFNYEPFEQLSSGRSRVAIRIDEPDKSIWAIRVEDPDREIAGRIWTTEIAVADCKGDDPKFTVRLLVASPEVMLEVEPHVPGVVRQIINKPGLHCGAYRLIDKPMPIKSDSDANLLMGALLDPYRTLPIIVLSIPSGSYDPYLPNIDARQLAQACAGLAIVIILPAQFTWNLTERFGPRLSVYEGAVRIYQRGFTEDANPFGGHDLILADRFSNPEGAAITLKRLRWSAALGSITNLSLGTDVMTFASLRLRSLERQQMVLQSIGTTDKEQLETAIHTIKILEDRVAEENRLQQQFSVEHENAEERAKSAEAQLLASGFRIQQLIEQLKEAGTTPDATITLPHEWADFAAWCDANLAGRVILSPQARRGLRDSVFENVELAARCLLWLANEYRAAKTSGGARSLRDVVIAHGIINAHCGSDQFEFEWQARSRLVDWHIKNGGNTRDPKRCLRIYYFWDDLSQQAVIASMPEHRRTDAS